MSLDLYNLLNFAHTVFSLPGIHISQLLWTECLHSPKLTCWNPKPWCDGIWRWRFGEVIGVRLGHERRVLVKEFMHLQKEDKTWDLLPLCTHQGRPREALSRKGVPQWTRLACWPWTCSLQSCGTCFLFKSSSLWSSVISWTDSDTSLSASFLSICQVLSDRLFPWDVFMTSRVWVGYSS